MQVSRDEQVLQASLYPPLRLTPTHLPYPTLSLRAGFHVAGTAQQQQQRQQAPLPTGLARLAALPAAPSLSVCFHLTSIFDHRFALSRSQGFRFNSANGTT
jgi:hypothetical protein